MGIEGSETHSEFTPDGDGNQSSTGHSDGSECVGPYSETAEQSDLDTFRKALAESREEMAEDAKVRNSVSTTFAEEFAALADAVRNSLEAPDASERQLPSVQELAKAWGRSFLDGYRRISLYRQGLLYEHLAALPAGRRVLVEHLQALRPEAPLPPSIEDMPDQENLAALAIMSSQQFVLADAAYIEEVHRVWTRATDDLGIQTADGKPLKHPLAPMIDGWFFKPVNVELNEKAAKIVPSRFAMVKASDRRAPALWSPAAHLALVEGEHQFLPGFERESVEGPMLPTELYDLGEPKKRQGGGAGAQLSLRLFFHAASSLRLEDRGGYRAKLLPWTLRQIRDELYPKLRIDGRKRSTTATKVLEQVLRARETLNSMDGLVPYYDLATGRWRRRQIVSVVDVPDQAADLDDFVVISVFLPDGMEKGGTLPATLNRWGVESAPAYRMLLNLTYHWWQPGQTHYPVKGRWFRKWDPRGYPEISDRLLVQLAYPTSVHQQFRVLAFRADKVLDVLKKRGLRVVPQLPDSFVVEVFAGRRHECLDVLECNPPLSETGGDYDDLRPWQSQGPNETRRCYRGD